MSRPVSLPLPGLAAPRRPRRCLSAWERFLREARRAGVEPPLAAPVLAALGRTLAQAVDERVRFDPEVSLHQLATTSAELRELARAYTGDAVGAASFDEIRAALSAAPVDASSD